MRCCATFTGSRSECTDHRRTEAVCSALSQIGDVLLGRVHSPWGRQWSDSPGKIPFFWNRTPGSEVTDAMIMAVDNDTDLKELLKRNQGFEVSEQ